MFDYRVEIRMVPNPESKVAAVASIVIDEMLKLHSMKIIRGPNGLFVSPPASKGKDSEGNEKYYDEIQFYGERGLEAKHKIYQLIIDEYYRRKE